MEEYTEVGKVVDMIDEALYELDLQQQTLRFKRRAVIEKFWTQKADELLESINFLEHVVHEKELMIKAKSDLRACYYNQENFEKPLDKHHEYIQNTIDKIKGNNPE